MEPKKAFKTFRFRTGLVWKSGRRGTMSSLGKPEVEISSAPEFKGEPGLWSPEDLLVGAVESCLMLTFLALAQAKGLEPLSYESHAEGLLESLEGKYRITEITVEPTVMVRSEADLAAAREISSKVEANCFISNSTKAHVTFSPQVRVGA